MSAILDHLQLDHRNMGQLLRILEEELEFYNTRRAADFDLLKQIMEYTLHYPNLIHHPREEMLFRRLLERNPASKNLVGDLTKEHEELAHLTHRFAAALHQVAHDVELPRSLFMKVAEEYIGRSRQHMASEERILFPRLQAVLSDADWDEFNEHATHGYDPLFGNAVERHYKDLHQRVLSTCL